MVSLLVCVIVAAIIFDYINGFHDAANAIATVVSTGVLPVRTAVLIAGILNFVGAMSGTAVAKTIASGFADPAIVTQTVVLSALIGACIWNLITWWYGIPSSSSHALIGGLCGAVVAKAGVSAFKWAALKQKVLIPLVASPLIGYKKDMIISGDYKPAATLNMLLKDLDLLLATAGQHDTRLPVNSMIRNIYRDASDRGLGEKDFFVLIQEAEKQAV